MIESTKAGVHLSYRAEPWLIVDLNLASSLDTGAAKSW
jgi:hypothetical protein